MKKMMLYFGGILLVCASCSDFLEPRSNTQFIPEDVSALRELMIAEVYTLNIAMAGPLVLLDDDVDGGEFIEGRTSAVEGPLAAFSWQPDMFEIFGAAGMSDQWFALWRDGYSRILGCNAVLDYVDDVNGLEETRNELKAQAFTMRAFNYLYIVKIFGAPYSYDKKALGVPLKLNSNIEESLMSRNTVKECYARIEKDLLEAERLYLTIPVEKRWRPDYKASLPMAQLLLSRVYLEMENWEQAHKYAEKVISDYAFRLKDLNEFVPTEDVPYYDFCNVNCPEQIFSYSRNGCLTVFPREGIPKNRWNYVASHGLLKCYSESDLRKDNYIIDEPGCKKEAPEGMPWDTLVRRPVGKYGVNSNRSVIESAQSVLSLRVAEAYLNSMEAAAFLYKAGDAQMQTKAMERLEDLRYMRYRRKDYRKLSVFSDAEALISYIREERRRELCFEGHRWNDLRRYGMPEIKHRWNLDGNQWVEYTLKEKDPAYTLPIPESTRTRNSSLVQNPLAPKREGVAVR